MTLLVNKLTFNVFQHETEEKSKIFTGLKRIFPEELQDTMDKLFKEDVIIGYHKNKIIKYNLELKKNKETQRIFINLIRKLLKSCSYFDLFDRISDNGELFIRLSKQDLIKGSIRLDDSSDVYKIVAKFLFFNKKVDKVNEIYNFLKEIPLE